MPSEFEGVAPIDDESRARLRAFIGIGKGAARGRTATAFTNFMSTYPRGTQPFDELRLIVPDHGVKRGLAFAQSLVNSIHRIFWVPEDIQVVHFQPNEAALYGFHVPPYKKVHVLVRDRVPLTGDLRDLVEACAKRYNLHQRGLKVGYLNDLPYHGRKVSYDDLLSGP